MKIYGRIANFLQRYRDSVNQGNNNNNNSNSNNNSGSSSLLPSKKRRSPYNGMIFADLLCDLINRKSVSLSFVRRMTLIESIKDVVKKQKQKQQKQQQQQQQQEEESAAREQGQHQEEEEEEEHNDDEEQEEMMLLLLLTEVVMEGILTAPTLQNEDKDVIVREGLIEKRWDRVFCYFDRSTTTDYRIGPDIGDESKWCTMFHNNNNNNNNNTTSTVDSTI